MLWQWQATMHLNGKGYKVTLEGETTGTTRRPEMFGPAIVSPDGEEGVSVLFPGNEKSKGRGLTPPFRYRYRYR